MYEETRENNTLRDILLQLLFVVLFIFVLCWLFPTKSYLNERLTALENNSGLNEETSNKIDALTARLYQENIDTMKDAAKSYFTLSRLPQKTGDTVKLTLKEMYEKNLLLTIYDKNNDTCSAKESYVEVAKADNEYVMKVNLKCGKEEAFVLEHMGCYDYCKTTICAKQTTTSTVVVKPVVKTYMYQYKLVTNGKWGNYGAWSEWTKNTITANDYTQIDMKTEKEFDHYEQVYQIVGYKTVTATATNSCPAGYTDNGSYCVRTISTPGSSYTSTVAATKSCPSGYTDNGTNCAKTTTTGGSTSTIAATVSYTCPSGYTRNGSSCTKQVANGTSKTYSGRTESTSTKSSTSTTQYVFVSSRKEVSCTSTCKTVNYYTYDVYKITTNYTTSTIAATASYTCPSGYTKNGTNCTKTTSGSTSTVTTGYTYTCPSGYTKNGTSCTKTTTTSGSTSTETVSYTKTCPSGYSINGSICSKQEAVYGYVNGEAVYKDVKYYRSRTRQYISGTVDYKWSYSNSDKTLLGQGYSLTGVTKQV